MKGFVTADEARAIAAIPKKLHGLHGQFALQKRNNHAGHLVQVIWSPLHVLKMPMVHFCPD